MAKRYKRSKLMPVLAVCGVFVGALLVVPITSLKEITSYVSYPLVHAGSWFVQKREERLNGQKSHETIAHELQDATVKIAQLESRVHELEQSESLYGDIQELVDFRKRFGAVYSVVAPVARRDLSVARQHFIVDSGSTSGVKVGMVALADHRLLGRVTEVYPLYAIVSLITDPSISVAAIGGTSKTTGVVRGTGNKDRVQLAYVDHLTPLVVGEQVVSSGEGLLFPRGFLIGTLVSDEIAGIYHKAYVDLAVDLSRITQVLLISPADCKPCISIPKSTVAEVGLMPLVTSKQQVKKERVVQQEKPKPQPVEEVKPLESVSSESSQEARSEAHSGAVEQPAAESHAVVADEILVVPEELAEENLVQSA
jgi:rod shape-determining protein MreC